MNEWLVVDVDMTDLPIRESNRTYERASFGFMQKEKGKVRNSSVLSRKENLVKYLVAYLIPLVFIVSLN